MTAEVWRGGERRLSEPEVESGTSDLRLGTLWRSRVWTSAVRLGCRRPENKCQGGAEDYSHRSLQSAHSTELYTPSAIVRYHKFTRFFSFDRAPRGRRASCGPRTAPPSRKTRCPYQALRESGLHTLHTLERKTQQQGETQMQVKRWCEMLRANDRPRSRR